MKINEKNLCAFATTPPVDLEGWLSKKGEVNKSWQKRWFVLKGNLLFYFEKKSDKEPLGVIILEGCTVELAEETENYCFQLIFHGVNNRTYYLGAESQESMEIWMKALTCSGYEYIKLMVSELQRQLAEIEGNNGRIAATTIDPNVIPKPPPRRHNPFNRPVPIVPGSKSQIIVSNIMNTNPPPAVPIASQRATNADPSAYPTLNNLQSTISEAASSMASVLQNPQPKNDNIFNLVHELLGKPILKDFYDRKMNNEKNLIQIEDPLILL